ncbi:MAG TPA: IS6 family transposase [Thermoplasmatales archaeon]|nr:IS6 family transposase [Thermoplasmatales archaeon]
MLERCENKPLILVDKGPWYKWALQRLGLEYKHQGFGERNVIEQWYNLFKSRVKNFWKRFPYHSSLQSVKNLIFATFPELDMEISPPLLASMKKKSSGEEMRKQRKSAKVNTSIFYHVNSEGLVRDGWQEKVVP